MNDINTSGLSKHASFQGDWGAVLEFLGGILLKNSVKKVSITRTREDAWKVDVSGLKQGKKPKASMGGLYDLYW